MAEEPSFNEQKGANIFAFGLVGHNKIVINKYLSVNTSQLSLIQRLRIKANAS